MSHAMAQDIEIAYLVALRRGAILLNRTEPVPNCPSHRGRPKAIGIVLEEFPTMGSTKARAGRDALAGALWGREGERRLPSTRALDQALYAVPPGNLWRLCELSPSGPLYFLPTREWIAALGRACARLGRRVLEVGAGDGFVSRCLRAAQPELEVIATDSGAWEKPTARMTASEARSRLGRKARGLKLGPDVFRLDAVSAVRRYRPDVVLAIWLPPGPLLSRLIAAPCRYVLEVGAAGGVTAAGNWDWRFSHELLDGPLETRARCRLDDRPKQRLHTTVTLYHASLHPDFAVERPRPGDWLYQFKPARH
jgi:hypothetical protein